MDISATDLKRNHRYVNEGGLSPVDLVKRKNDMKILSELYPNLCPSMIEVAWNFCNAHSEEELQEIISKRTFEKPCTRALGGVYKGCTIIKGKE